MPDSKPIIFIHSLIRWFVPNQQSKQPVTCLTQFFQCSILNLQTNLFKTLVNTCKPSLQMPIPNQCQPMHCPLQCCDINGYCPSIRADCYYFYNQQYFILPAAIIIAIVIGAICVLTVLIMAICFCIKRFKKTKIQAQMPARIFRGVLPYPGEVIIGQRQELSYGTNSFQDLTMAQNRQNSYPPSYHIPSNADPYFYSNQIQYDPNGYPHS